MSKIRREKKIAVISWMLIMLLIVGCNTYQESVEINQVSEGKQEIIEIKDTPVETTTASHIQVSFEEADEEDLILVNNKNPLPEEYHVELKWLPSGRKQVASKMYDDLQRMLLDGTNEGLSFVVASGYRSKDYQQELWDDTIKMWKCRGLNEEDAVTETVKTLAYPGESEHATGLAVDIVSESYQLLDERQHDTKESTWLRENCYKYGFILRYPKGKEEITGITYESWHFRYVGIPVATCIMEHQLTLEEYIAYCQENFSH